MCKHVTLPCSRSFPLNQPHPLFKGTKSKTWAGNWKVQELLFPMKYTINQISLLQLLAFDDDDRLVTHGSPPPSLLEGVGGRPSHLLQVLIFFIPKFASEKESGEKNFQFSQAAWANLKYRFLRWCWQALNQPSSGVRYRPGPRIRFRGFLPWLGRPEGVGGRMVVPFDLTNVWADDGMERGGGLNLVTNQVLGGHRGSVSGDKAQVCRTVPN